MFFKKVTFTVADSTSSKQVALDRIVGKLVVNIEDAIPANADKFYFRFEDTHRFMFATEKPDTVKTSHLREHFSTLFTPIKAEEKGLKSYRFEKLLLNTELPSNVIIECYDSSNNLIASKTVTEVRVFKNKRTILTGRLFEQATSFSVSVNSTWSTDSTYTKF